MRSFHQMICLWVILMGLLMGCARVSSSPFGSMLEAQVTSQVLFSQVAQNPQAFVGNILKVGGEVLSAKRLSDRTEIMVLQIPLNEDSMPGSERIRSLGRFIATQEAFLDPATVPSGTRLTIIGEITGQATVPVGEQERIYPVLAIKALHVWPIVHREYLSRVPYPWGPTPFWGSYWGPSPYWSPYWAFPRSPYWHSRRHSGMRRGRR